MGEVDLKGEGDEGVGQREHEVSREGGAPAPEDELREFEGWVVPWGDVLHVDGHVEGEGEEGDYYEVWCAIPLALYT